MFNNLAPWGEKKFRSKFCEFRNFRETDNLKYSCRNSNSDLPKQLRCIPLNKFLMLGRKFNLFFETVFSRFTSYFSRKCTAFTLAEVLITLGIIGVVAAMTMPTLINNINNKANINKLKREYSLFQQAFQQIAADNDLEFKNAVADCPDSTKHACLKDIFKSKLKTVADCDSNDGDNLGKCFVQDKDAKKLNGESVPLSAGYFNQNTTSGLVLDDGASAAIWLDAMIVQTLLAV